MLNNYYTVSVDKAISYGIWFIFFPCFILLLGTPLSVYFLKISNWYIFLGFIVGFCLAYLYWLISIAKWKIWALNNVRNVHELYNKAIEKYLINKPHSFLAKTEFALTKEDKQKIAELETLRFSEPDIYGDDLSIPYETEVYFSKTNLIIFTILSFGLFYFFIFDNNVEREDNIKIKFLLPFSVFMMIRYALKSIKKYPVFILSDKGIIVENNNIQNWENTTVRIERLNSLSNSIYIKIDYFDSEAEEIKLHEFEIDDLKISRSRLEHLINVYKYRYANKYNK